MLVELFHGSCAVAPLKPRRGVGIKNADGTVATSRTRIQERRWQKTAVPPRADSTRIIYLDPKTGEMCYRLAEWKPDGIFEPCSDAPGIGVDFDRKRGEPETGSVYPVDEF